MSSWDWKQTNMSLIIFSNTSLFTPKSSINKNPLTFNIPISKFHKPSSSFLLFTKKSFQISAHFNGGRHTRRTNYLRKKLLDAQKVRKDLIFINPDKGFGQILDKGNVKDTNFIHVDEPEETKHLGESVLMKKLENWVDQYKKDSEFWGFGTAHIFTVYEDVKGNVERVFVNEDEILSRSQVMGLDSAQVSSKITYAKNLAREMEAGGNVIERNSLVAKFVVSGEKSGFVGMIRHAIVQPEFLPTVSRFGKMMFFGLVAVWALTKLFGLGNKKEEHTPLEKEMLRRKLKARELKEKEQPLLVKGSVVAVEKLADPEVLLLEKPKLDRQELMTSIQKAKSSIAKPVLLDSPSIESAKSLDFDDKIQEIREMARRAREIEGGEESPLDQDATPKITEELAIESKQVREEAPTVLNNPLNKELGDDSQSITEDLKESENHSPLSGKKEDFESSEKSVTESYMLNGNSTRKKRKVITSVKEAKEYLSKKHGTQEFDMASVVKMQAQRSPVIGTPSREAGINKRQILKTDPDSSKSVLKSALPNANENPTANFKEPIPIPKNVPVNHPISSECKDTVDSTDTRPSAKTENWIEKNFHEVEPILAKIGTGFQDNYKVAREKKATEQLNMSADLSELVSTADASEFEWMEDDRLKEIVFQVRDNELAGRDPFYLMDAEDKNAFFQGLQKKVEKENEKLAHVHEWLHSNIENVDYGADGISIYDPPEKIIPRWKGPTLEKNPEFLDNYMEQRKAIFPENSSITFPANKDEQKHAEPSPSSLASNDIKGHKSKTPKSPKTVIETSDGSVRPGKKSAKEYWQHTKKWSREFLESYNAESDPEVKSIMKDMGKGLDRWITEKEIQEAGELMDKLPERNKEFIEKKINKLKREMELFGPQAVVSKYSEYADEKKEDYLWWLDLPHVLCVELYTMQDGEQKIGFYSLEMATDLELEPKPQHMIAFEDAGDCKNFCHIVQVHMDMLGNGQAFVVPQPPKDAFREAKANGFGVSVIRKGELQLNVDQTLEEVEEQIEEIGSKIYHDKIMGERSVDISTMMKGVFGSSIKPAKRKRSKKKLKKPGKK
ncbi:hypothetical protein ACFE04_026427 [Oxalis oulophora]